MYAIRLHSMPSCKGKFLRRNQTCYEMSRHFGPPRCGPSLDWGCSTARMSQKMSVFHFSVGLTLWHAITRRHEVQGDCKSKRHGSKRHEQYTKVETRMNNVEGGVYMCLMSATTVYVADGSQSIHHLLHDAACSTRGW